MTNQIDTLKRAAAEASRAWGNEATDKQIGKIAYELDRTGENANDWVNGPLTKAAASSLISKLVDLPDQVELDDDSDEIKPDFEFEVGEVMDTIFVEENGVETEFDSFDEFLASVKSKIDDAYEVVIFDKNLPAEILRKRVKTFDEFVEIIEPALYEDGKDMVVQIF